MRHNNKINHLGRTYSHRDAMLSNMAVSLIKHKRIFTTLAKAKELRKYIEPLITKSKTDTTHSRRIVFKNLSNKFAIKELFQEISQKIGDRPGGYTRIIKTGNRLGDNASTCFIELVDYNELMLKDKAPAKAKTRRSRRGAGTGKGTTPAAEIAEVVESAPKKASKAKAKKPVIETSSEEIPAVETPVAETASIAETPNEENISSAEEEKA
jgi:large subunit ribosomal protein L17